MAKNFEHNFFSMLSRMREKPKIVRQTYALGIAIGITGVVALSWLGTIAVSGKYPGISDTQRQRSAAARAASAQQYGMLKNEFAKQLEESPERARVKELLSQLEQQRKEEATAAVMMAQMPFASSSATGTIDASSSSTQTVSDPSTLESDPSSDPYGTNY